MANVSRVVNYAIKLDFGTKPLEEIYFYCGHWILAPKTSAMDNQTMIDDPAMTFTSIYRVIAVYCDLSVCQLIRIDCSRQQITERSLYSVIFLFFFRPDFNLFEHVE